METSFSTSAKPAVEVKENWWGEARAIFLKDLRSELRTKAAISSILVYSLTTMVLLSFTIKTFGLGLTVVLVDDTRAAALAGQAVVRAGETQTRSELLASLYWVIIYFSAMAGLPRVFVKEEEMRTAAMLRLTADPTAVFAGKTTFNLVLISSITLILLPLFILFMRPQVANWPLLLAHLLAGSAALASVATILGAMASRAGNHGYLMVVLGFGPLLPILIPAINGTTAALYGSGGNNLMALVSYLVAMTILSALLFERVWSE